MKSKLPLLVLSLTCLAVSCGKHKSGHSLKKTVSPLQDQTAEGSYRAILRPMNNQLSGFIPSGAAEIKITDDQVDVKTLLDDDDLVIHRQSILTGSRCPVAADDKNNDGILDIQESLKASGNVLIPLDSDLNSAEEGKNIYPVGSGFTYLETASLSKLESDTKQRTNQSLNLAGRVVIIHGVAPTAILPGSVATRDGMTQQLSVPIACGVLKRLK